MTLLGQAKRGSGPRAPGTIRVAPPVQPPHHPAPQHGIAILGGGTWCPGLVGMPYCLQSLEPQSHRSVGPPPAPVPRKALRWSVPQPTGARVSSPACGPCREGVRSLGRAWCRHPTAGARDPPLASARPGNATLVPPRVAGGPAPPPPLYREGISLSPVLRFPLRGPGCPRSPKGPAGKRKHPPPPARPPPFVAIRSCPAPRLSRFGRPTPRPGAGGRPPGRFRPNPFLLGTAPFLPLVFGSPPGSSVHRKCRGGGAPDPLFPDRRMPPLPDLPGPASRGGPGGNLVGVPG